MYSLFLFTSLLSFLALLSALEPWRAGGASLSGGSRSLLTLASHPYAVLVVAAQALYVLLRRQASACSSRRRSRRSASSGFRSGGPTSSCATASTSASAAAGRRLGSPASVLHYFWWVAGDFSAGPPRLVDPGPRYLPLAGAVLVWRRRPRSVLLIALRRRRSGRCVHARDAATRRRRPRPAI